MSTVIPKAIPITLIKEMTEINRVLCGERVYRKPIKYSNDFTTEATLLKKPFYFNSIGSGCYTCKSNTMTLTLLIDQLLPPPPQGEALWQSVKAPALKTILAHARPVHCLPGVANDRESWLGQALGLKRQEDWPWASLMAHEESLSDAAKGYWLFASPVYLDTQRQGLILNEPTKISPLEYQALSTTLCEHFNEAHIDCHPTSQFGQGWLLRIPQPQQVHHFNVSQVVGNNIRHFLPKGPHSAYWHRLLTETQMILHDHTINLIREKDGHPPINSVWFWGGGTRPTPEQSPFKTVHSVDPMIKAIARFQSSLTPVMKHSYEDTPLNEGSHLLIFDHLSKHWRQHNLNAWIADLENWDRQWMRPVLNDLKNRRIHELHLISTDVRGIQQWSIKPRDFLKFWRTSVSLSSLFDAHKSP